MPTATSNQKRSIIDPLKLALNFEIKGAIFYLNFATKIKHALAKKLFYSLAAKEIEHAQKVDEIFGTIKENKEFKNLTMKTSSNVEKEIKDYFLKSKQKTLKKSLDNLKGYELALDMEKKSYDVYKDLYKKSKDPIKKKFFEGLMNEEKEHYDAIANVYNYLTGSGDWLQSDESKVWNWMNI
ncbi:MAG: ferritin family protein [Endomicrobiales bacterium]|nr:ferritin family protein [Endomicrobiales bacterium]